MIIRAVCFAGLATLSVACGTRPPAEVVEPAPQQIAHGPSTLEFPAVDSATLASLDALLEQLQQQSSLLSALAAPEPRMYALVRQLEASQETLNAVLSAPDPTGRSLYDRLTAFMTRADSAFQLLERLNRQPPRP